MPIRTARHLRHRMLGRRLVSGLVTATETRVDSMIEAGIADETGIATLTMATMEIEIATTAEP